MSLPGVFFICLTSRVQGVMGFGGCKCWDLKTRTGTGTETGTEEINRNRIYLGYGYITADGWTRIPLGRHGGVD